MKDNGDEVLFCEMLGCCFLRGADDEMSKMFNEIVTMVSSYMCLLGFCAIDQSKLKSVEY